MKAVGIIDGFKVEVLEQELPKTLAADMVLLKVRAIGLCNEYRGYKDGWQLTYPYDRPQMIDSCDIFGHEVVGEVVESAVKMYKKSDRVVVQPLLACGGCEFCERGDFILCPYGFDYEDLYPSKVGLSCYAQYVIRPYWMLSPIAKDISYKHALMALCGFGPAFGAFQRIKKRQNEFVVVIGCGPVGLGAIIVAKSLEYSVIAIESQRYRRELAKDLGADHIFHPLENGLVGRIQVIAGMPHKGAGAVLECSGGGARRDLALSCAGLAGDVALIGQGGHLLADATSMLNLKRLSIYGIWHYNIAGYGELMEIIRGNGDKIDKMITHIFPLTATLEAWRLQMSGRCGKIVIDPWME